MWRTPGSRINLRIPLPDILRGPRISSRSKCRVLLKLPSPTAGRGWRLRKQGSGSCFALFNKAPRVRGCLCRRLPEAQRMPPEILCLLVLRIYGAWFGRPSTCKLEGPRSWLAGFVLCMDFKVGVRAPGRPTLADVWSGWRRRLMTRGTTGVVPLVEWYVPLE